MDGCDTNFIAAVCCTIGTVALVALIVLVRSGTVLLTTTSGLMLLGGSLQAAYILASTGGDVASGRAYSISRDPLVHDIIYYVLLPPIIFEAGFTMRKRQFFANFWSIMLLAIVGTLIAIIVCGGLLFALAEAGVFATRFTLNQMLLFSSLISSTDPIATLAVLKVGPAVHSRLPRQDVGPHTRRRFSPRPPLPNDGRPRLTSTCAQVLKVQPPLYDLIFGESALNDALSIVLFNLFKVTPLARIAAPPLTLPPTPTAPEPEPRPDTL